MIVLSYFSIPTDLATAMSEWPEFVSGEGYSVELKDSNSGEEVSVRFVENRESADYIQISANRHESLYQKVVGRVIIDLLPHTDNLMVHSDFKTDE